MTFLNPFVLFGLLAASLPVLFHLFAQKRARKVEFSSLRFLEKLEKTSMRTVKVRQILLLIIRTLLVVCLVLAFARPALKGYLGGFFGTSHANSTMAFLVDNSASMSRSDEGGELFKQSKEASLQIARLMEDGDEAVVIPLASIQRGKEYTPIHSKAEVLQVLNDIQLVDRPAQLEDGLRVASSTLSKSLNVNKEVYILTDGQARNLRTTHLVIDSTTKEAKADTSHLKLFDDRSKLFVVPFGGKEMGRGANLSLDSIKPKTTVFEPGRPIDFDVFVRNTSETPVENAVISLFYNDERVAQRSLNVIEPGKTEQVSIEGAARGSGIISVRAELEQDALPFDNKRYTVVAVPATRHIGLFVQNPSDVTFIQLALGQKLTETGSLPFSTEVHTLGELRNLPASGNRFDAVIAGIGAEIPSPEDVNGLKSYVAGGHGAAVFLMPNLNIQSFGELAPQLNLPRATSKNGSPTDNSRYVSFSQIDFAHPFFSGLFEESAGNTSSLRGIESPKFYEFYTLEQQKGLTLIRFSNGTPFLTESSLGKGSILLFAAPPTLSFSDFPRKSVFLPVIRRTAAYASSIQAKRDENVQTSYVTTEPFDIELPQLAAEQSGATVLIKAPDGSSERAQVLILEDGRARLHLEQAKVAGNYTVYRDAEGREPIAAFAVNIQSDESDLASATDEEMHSYLLERTSGRKESVVTLTPKQKSFGEAVIRSRFGVELWQTFLWAAAILALLEMIIAREARRNVVAPAGA